VTGFKQSYANAVRAKKNAIEITDGISSDGLGRFPDLNVGEGPAAHPGRRRSTARPKAATPPSTCAACRASTPAPR
jgi:hypothetical protein